MRVCKNSSVGKSKAIHHNWINAKYAYCKCNWPLHSNVEKKTWFQNRQFLPHSWTFETGTLLSTGEPEREHDQQPCHLNGAIPLCISIQFDHRHRFLCLSFTWMQTQASTQTKPNRHCIKCTELSCLTVRPTNRLSFSVALALPLTQSQYFFLNWNHLDLLHFARVSYLAFKPPNLIPHSIHQNFLFKCKAKLNFQMISFTKRSVHIIVQQSKAKQMNECLYAVC